MISNKIYKYNLQELATFIPMQLYRLLHLKIEIQPIHKLILVSVVKCPETSIRKFSTYSVRHTECALQVIRYNLPQEQHEARIPALGYESFIHKLKICTCALSTHNLYNGMTKNTCYNSFF